MKLFKAICILSTLVTVQAECDDEQNKCLPKNHACTDNPEGCCDSLGCFGFGFFKRCQEPPACLAEWNDCSQGMDCCGELVCAVTAKGAHECQRRTIDTDVVDPLDGNEKTTDTKEINTRTTKIPGQPVNTVVGCSVGDPHIYTFDGLAHDCQAEGEFILVKSTYTQRQIQGRFAHFADRFSEGNAWAVTKGVAIQDEGDTPLVQFNIPTQDSSLFNKIGSCPIQFFVDGVQRDIENGSGKESKVKVTLNDNGIDVLYVVSEMKVTITFGDANGCFLNVCVYLPDSDKTTYGLLGTPNGNPMDDWMTSDNKGLVVPASLHDRMNQKGYGYCTSHHCIREEAKSLFTYAEKGIDFEDIMHCDLPYGNTLEELFVDIDPEVLAVCGEELMCIMDSRIGGVATSKETKKARLAVQETCNGVGGECNVASCCDGLKCVEATGFAKECAREVPLCVGEWANCASTPCCDDLLCEELNDGRHMCRDLPECMPEWRDCSVVDCCGEMTCVARPDGTKQCRDLPQCMSEWGDCSLGVDCCDGLKCVKDANHDRMHCVDAPTCQSKEWRDCSETPCCDGLTCVEENGNKACRKLPSCVNEWQSCKYVGCCQDGPKPLKCFEFTDASGRPASQCQAACANTWNQCSDDKPCCNEADTCKDFGGVKQCAPP